MKYYKIAIDSILYIEGLKDYIRIHRSYIIPAKKIKVIEGNRIQMSNSEYLPIGETYRKLVGEWVENK